MGEFYRGALRSLLRLATAGLVLAAPVAAVPAQPPDPSSMVAQVGPSVVNIDTEMGYASAVGAGTGIVLDPSGVVLTNNHVLNGATGASAVSIADGRSYPVDVLGYDRSHDVAVIQLLGAAGLPAATLGTGAPVAVGDPVISMGNAGGQGGTPSAVAGHIVALNQTVTAADELTGSSETLNGMIQADAPIRPGDSGGPLINAAGQVIGMNTAASDNFKFNQPGGQGFAIPIAEALAIANQIRSGAASNTVHIGDTAFLGVGVVDNGGGGVRVQRVLADTPAADAGIELGDVITAVDNAPVASPTALTEVMDQHHPGDVIELTWRGPAAGVRSAKITLGAGPVG